jgi:two-component system, OmpR family, KDP operon response regulator KdpE
MSGLICMTEDDADMGALLQSALEREGWQVRWFRNAETTRRAWADLNPVVWLLDLGLPDGDGLDLLRTLGAPTQGAVLVLSARGFEHHKVQALDAGADDYLVKPFGMGELMARLRVLHRRFRAPHHAAQRYAVDDLVIDLEQHAVSRQGQPLHLTPIEFALLEALVRAKGRLLTHRKLLHEVWGSQAVDQTHYLRVYMGKLRAKIEPIPAEPRIVITETGVGYRLNGLSEP